MRRDRLRELIEAVVGSLDDRLDGPALAGRAFLSRFHFDRLVGAGLGETPAGLRRRLLLERAAWHIGRGDAVTDAAAAAGYTAPEAFTRAFARLHGVPPSRFDPARRDFRVPAPNGIHFHPPDGLVVTGRRAGAARGGGDRVTGVMVGHDRWMTGALIDAAAGLGDADLDRPVRPGRVVLWFDGPEPSARRMLDRLVWAKEVWTAAIGGAEPPRAGGMGIAEVRARHDAAGAAFEDLVAAIDREGRWDDSFIDALCDPPQAFTNAGAVAHVLTIAAHRRAVLAEVLSGLGAGGVPPLCPMEWQRMAASAAPRPADELRGAPRPGGGWAEPQERSGTTPPGSAKVTP